MDRTRIAGLAYSATKVSVYLSTAKSENNKTIPVYDLVVECEGQSVRFDDAARSKEQAMKMATLLSKENVGCLHAAYVLEDLLADPEFIE